MTGEAFNYDRALELAEYAELVMEDPHIIKAAFGDMGQFTHLKAWFDRPNGTAGGLLMFDSHAVLAFRATEIRLDRPWESLKDIRTDLMFRPVPFGEAMVHRGFLGAYGSVAADVKNALKNIGPEVPLFITGHSLGGALAKIAGMDLPAARISAIYTFGAPRVGDGAVDRQIGAPLYQFINAADIVPRVPLLSLGYRGAGDRRFIARDGSITRGTGLKSMATFFWSAMTCPTRLVRDHDLAGQYSPPIQAAAETAD